MRGVREGVKQRTSHLDLTRSQSRSNVVSTSSRLDAIVVRERDVDRLRALDDVRERGLKALPVCGFVQGFIARHPDYADLDYRAPASTVTD